MSTAQKRQPIPFGKYLLLDRVNIGGMCCTTRIGTGKRGISVVTGTGISRRTPG